MTGRRTEILLLQAPLYWDIYVPLDLDSARLAFTCHNFEYRGSEPAGALASCGLNVQSLLRPDLMQDNSSPKKISILKGGLVFSNVVMTVSPTYAQEVLRPEGGKGLHQTLHQHSRKFLEF
jgi:starch synthase